jgi:hypothetical protein
MPIVPLESFGLGGLNTDFPRESLDTKFFDEGLNLRSKDGTLTGVPSWDKTNNTFRTFQAITDGAAYTVDTQSVAPFLMTQWSDLDAGQQYDVLVLGEHNSGNSKVNLVSSSESPSLSTELTSAFPTSDNIKYSQMFVFNEMAILNSYGVYPQYCNDRTDQFYPFPNWFKETDLLIGVHTAAVTGVEYEINTVILADWSPIGGPVSAVVGDKFVSTSTSDISAYGDVYSLVEYSADVVVPFNGRLVAFGLNNDRGDALASNDVHKDLLMAYSSSITAQNSLSGVEWYTDVTNSAGDLYLSDTPGSVIDAKQLGEFLMVYKKEAVYRFQDSGHPYYLTGDVVFNDDGVLTTNCIADIGGNTQIVVGNYGIYLHSSGPEKVSISEGTIDKFFYDDLPLSKFDRDLTFVFHNQLQKEVWICYRDKAASTVIANDLKGCTKALVYNYKDKTYYLRDLPNIRSIIETDANGVTTVLGGSADESANSGLLTAGWMYKLEDDGTVEPDGYIRFNARVMGSPHIIKVIDGLYPTSEQEFNIKFHASPTITKLDISGEPNDLFDPALDYKEDFRLSGRYLTLEINMNGSVDPKISGMNVDMQGGDPR